MKEETKVPWLVICLAAALPFLGFWLTGLTDLDEGYYGAVAAEMNRRGEWLIPFYNGSPWFEKPILLYWLAKPSLMLFGEVVGPRLPSVVCSLGTLAVVAWFVFARGGVAPASKDINVDVNLPEVSAPAVPTAN